MSHILIDKEVYVTPENRFTEVTPCILIFIPHFVHVEERIVLSFAFLHRLISKNLTKSLKKPVKIFPLMSTDFNHVTYYCSKTIFIFIFFIFLLKSHILFVNFASKLQVHLFHLKTTQKFGKKVEKIDCKVLWF